MSDKEMSDKDLPSYVTLLMEKNLKMDITDEMIASGVAVLDELRDHKSDAVLVREIYFEMEYERRMS